MEVILLERVAKLGQMGEVVRVKDGFARNFLLPKGKALRATEANKSKFEGMKVDLQAKNLETKGEADKIGAKLDGKSFPVIRQASETGQLYGSVSPRDLAALLTESGFEVDRNQIALNVPIKTIGQHKVPVHLHPEVEVTVTVNVARSADEAERLARGENVTVRREGGADEDEAEAAKAAAEAVFEPGAKPRRGRSGRRRGRRREAEGQGEPSEAAASGRLTAGDASVEDVVLLRRRRVAARCWRAAAAAAGSAGGAAWLRRRRDGRRWRALAARLGCRLRVVSGLGRRVGRRLQPLGGSARACGVAAGSSSPAAAAARVRPFCSACGLALFGSRFCAGAASLGPDDAELLRPAGLARRRGRRRCRPAVRGVRASRGSGPLGSFGR